MKKILGRWKKSFLIIALVFCSLLFITLDAREARRLFFVDRIVNSVVAPVQSSVTRLARRTKNIGTHYLFLTRVEKENAHMKKEIEQLKMERARLLEIEKQNDRLLGFLDFKRDFPGRTVMAEVIGNDFGSWFKTVIVNRGSESGIKTGMAAVASGELIGRTIDVAGNYSKVLLLTDFRNAVDAMIQRTRDRGIVKGENSNVLKMRYIPLNADVQIGDSVISSGLGGVYPKGFVIGKIAKIKRSGQNLFQEAEIIPERDFSKLEEVFIITEKP
jgi:rod shape-determining protein MreC